jgi:hypothetical protein
VGSRSPDARLPRGTPSNCICRCSRMRARLSPPRVLLPHTCTQDGWFLQPKCRPARLPRRTPPSNCICRCSRMRTRLPLLVVSRSTCPPISPHANSFVLGPAVINKHTHPTPPHTGFPMSAHLSRLRLFQRHLRSLGWVWVWVWDWIHSHTPPRTRSPFSRPHERRGVVVSDTQVCDGQTSSHRPRLVVSRCTCPPFPPPPSRSAL